MAVDKKQVFKQNLKIFIKPQNYKHLNKANLITFEERQTLRLLIEAGLSDEEKKTKFDAQIKKISELTITSLSNSTEKIVTEDYEEVRDFEFIKEFYANSGQNVIALVKSKLEQIADEHAIKPNDVKCEKCDKIYPATFDFNYSNFFVTGS